MRFCKYIFLFILFIFVCTKGLYGQTQLYDRYYVDSVIVNGNRKTKSNIILRELNFHQGDSIDINNVQELFRLNRLRLLTTGLFTTVTFNIDNIDEEKRRVVISLKAKENLPISVVPIAELADRNFNVWFIDQKASFDRINYGIKLFHYNLTGHSDKLKVTGQLGYTKKVEAEYWHPYINRKKTLGLYVNSMLTSNREISYITLENKQQFYNDFKNKMMGRYRIGGALQYKRRLLSQHLLGFEYNNIQVSDFVRDSLNVDFLSGNTELGYLSLYYKYIYAGVDIRAYPLDGNWFEATLRKDGLGLNKSQTVNLTNISFRFGKYVLLGGGWYYSNLSKIKTSLQRNKPPYFIYRALGYENDYLRGYEYYVIDGLDFFYTKNSLKFECWNDPLKTWNWLKKIGIDDIPLRIFATVNFDLGYVNDPYYKLSNSLNNIWLAGGGVGLDFLIYYTMMGQIELSYNQLNKLGVFLHYNIYFQ